MLNSKQRAELRKLAQAEPSVAQIGKDGLSTAVLRSVKDVLTARELIKCNVLPNCEKSAREVADELAIELHADVVQVIGTKCVLYKFNPEKHKKDTSPSKRKSV